MAQIVIEFGAPVLEPVLNAVLSLIEHPSALDLSFKSGDCVSTLATGGALDAIYQQFVEGNLTSATLRTDSATVRYGLVLTPHFDDQHLSMWMGTIELTTNDWRPYWERLLRFDGLAFVCVGDEEGVELTDEKLTVASFPWDEWPLLAAALRDRTGNGSDWVIRERASATSR